MEPVHRTIVILNLGHDLSLLSTRHMVLQSAGYLVESTSSIARALKSLHEGGFGLVVVCHSLSDGERTYLKENIRQTGSAMPMIFLSAANAPDDSRSASVSSGSEPSELLHKIEVVLRQGMPAGAR
jgi:DNA-binding response OmpR family regulator